MSISKSDLIKRVGERTGLENKEEILAYMNFSDNADWDDGLIMYGSVQHCFYEDLRSKLSPEEEAREKKLNEEIGNHLREGPTPLSVEAGEIYEKYLQIFIKKGLIQEPKFRRKNRTTKYPALLGYNYFNDSEIYRVTSGGNGRELI